MRIALWILALLVAVWMPYAGARLLFYFNHAGIPLHPSGGFLVISAVMLLLCSGAVAGMIVLYLLES